MRTGLLSILFVTIKNIYIGTLDTVFTRIGNALLPCILMSSIKSAFGVTAISALGRQSLSLLVDFLLCLMSTLWIKQISPS